LFLIIPKDTTFFVTRQQQLVFFSISFAKWLPQTVYQIGLQIGFLNGFLRSNGSPIGFVDGFLNGFVIGLPNGYQDG
jgi:hypothetical protein